MDKNGVAQIEHLEKVKQATKNPPPELQEYYDLEFPIELSIYWDDFLQLSKRRGSSEAGYLPISFLEINAWCSLTGNTVSQLWLDIIDMLDNTWLRVQATK